MHKQMAKKTVSEYQAQRGRLYETGEQAGRVLALRIRQGSSKNVITSISEQGQEFVKPQDILNVF